MREISLIFIVLFCIGCSNGTTVEVSATIVAVEVDDSWNGCSHQTIVRTEQGYADRVCGLYGKVGDNLRGYWTTGHRRYYVNGFSFILSNDRNLAPNPDLLEDK